MFNPKICINHRWTPLNKSHLKNVMMPISKVFNGVDTDFHRLYKNLQEYRLSPFR